MWRGYWQICNSDRAHKMAPQTVTGHRKSQQHRAGITAMKVCYVVVFVSLCMYYVYTFSRQYRQPHAIPTSLTYVAWHARLSVLREAELVLVLDGGGAKCLECVFESHKASARGFVRAMARAMTAYSYLDPIITSFGCRVPGSCL